MDVPNWLEYLEHTADEGVRVTAPNRKTALERAAWGMFSLLCDPATVEEETSVSIVVNTDDDVSLLIEWLTELNVKHQTDHLVLRRFEIDKIEDYALEAVAWGEPYDPERHDLLTEIKAVTYHESQLEQQDDQWIAQVIFDV